MKSAAIRNHLYSFIKVADDRKLKAIYSIVKKDVQEDVEWWKDKAFMSDLRKEYEDLNSGNAKGHTVEEVFSSYEKIKKKKFNK